MARPISVETRYQMHMMDSANRDLQTARTPIEKVRLSCLSRGTTGIMEIRKVFRRFDNDSNGFLSPDEFAQGIRETINLAEEDIEDLFHDCDINKSGSIDYNEFLRAIRPPLNQHRTNLIDQAFDKLDHTKDGKITLDDLKHVYKVYGNPDYLNGAKSEDELLREFLKNFERHVSIDGIVTKEEFIDYYSGVSASVDDDMYFDLMMRKAWKL